MKTMNCHDVEPWLNLPKEEIPAPLRLSIQGHLDVCPSCRREFEATESLVLKLQALPEVDPGETFWNRFPERVRQELAKAQRETDRVNENRKPQARRRFTAWFLPLSAAAGVAALTLAGIAFLYQVEIPQTAFSPNEEDLAALEENLDISIETPLESDDLPALSTWSNVNGGIAGYYEGLQELEPEDLDHFEQQLQEYTIPS
jgi:hypothetical protein